MTSMQASDEKKESRPTGMTVGGFVARFGALFGLAILVIILAILSPVFLKPDNLWNISRQATVNAMLAVGMLLAIITAGHRSFGRFGAGPVDERAGHAGHQDARQPVRGDGGRPGGRAGDGHDQRSAADPAAPAPPVHRHVGHDEYCPRPGAHHHRRLADLRVRPGGRAAQVLVLGAGSLDTIPVAFIVVLIVYGIYHVLLSNTALGRHIYAVGGNAPAARLSGINVDKTLLIVYSLCGFMAGMGALMLAGRTNSGYPTAATGAELDAIAAVIIGGASFAGGTGTVWGTLIGVVLIAVLRNGLVLLKVPTEWQIVAIGLVIIGAVYVDVLRQRARR